MTALCQCGVPDDAGVALLEEAGAETSLDVVLEHEVVNGAGAKGDTGSSLSLHLFDDMNE